MFERPRVYTRTLRTQCFLVKPARHGSENLMDFPTTRRKQRTSMNARGQFVLTFFKTFERNQLFRGRFRRQTGNVMWRRDWLIRRRGNCRISDTIRIV